MVTSLYAGILAVLFIRLSIDTILGRRKHQISLGYGPNNEIEAVVSAHANFTAYVPLMLALLFFAESSNVFPSFVIHILAALFTIGRIQHYLAFKAKKMNFKLRVIGMHLTLWPLLLLGFMNIYVGVKNLL